MKKFIWEGDYGARYVIHLGKDVHSEGYWLHLSSSMKYMYLPRQEIPDVSYIEKKLNVPRLCAWQIVHFLEAHRKERQALVANYPY